MSAEHHPGTMTARNRRLDRALHRSRELVELAAREILLAREVSGRITPAAESEAAPGGGKAPLRMIWPRWREEREHHRDPDIQLSGP
jgi:hypothetical protein